jgi:acyl dehydratase
MNYVGALLPRRRGDTLPATVLERRGVRVDRDHLARYDRVCGFRLDDALPATYPHVLAFPLALRLMTATGFPFPVIGLVHVANRITVHRPVGAGTPLDLSVRAEGLRPHRRGRQFDIVATATVDGTEVWRGVSTYLKKGAVPADVAKQDVPADVARPDVPADVGGQGASTYVGGRGASTYVGEGRASTQREMPAAPRVAARWRVPAGVGRDYAAVSGDRNPIHTSRAAARLFGFARPIAHGMWSKARCLAALEGRLPDRFTVDVAFQRPILVPATVSYTAARRDDGWEFGLESHLAGQLTHP